MVNTYKSKLPGISHLFRVLILGVWAIRVVAQCPTTIPSLADYEEGKAQLTLSGCLPMQAVLQNQVVGATKVLTYFDYTGGSLNGANGSPDNLHRYTRPGTYTIVQVAEKDGKEWISCENVKVGDTIAPVVRAIPCADGNVQLTFAENQPTDYPTYQIDWGDTEIKGYTGFGNKIYYKYAAPASYKIRVRGIHTPGQCRGAIREITYNAPESLTGPSFTEGRATTETTVDFLFENPMKTELTLLRGSPDGAFFGTGILLDSTQTSVTATSVLPSSVCFRLQPTDSCLASLTSEPVCVSNLTLKGSSTLNVLDWEIPFLAMGQTAVVQKDGKDWRDITNQGKQGSLSDREFVCGNKVCYQLVVRKGSYVFYSLARCAQVPIEDCVSRPPFYIPEAFSPNGDGINDSFEIKGVISSEFELTVYNSWGTAVFYSSDPGLSWDGTTNGRRAMPGTYVYRIRYRDVSGARLTKEGAVVLMR